MNCCQKHQNHHCVHAHECKNPQHQRHIQKKISQKCNKTTHLQGRNGSQNCIFVKNIPQRQGKDVNNELLKLLHEKELKIAELSHAGTATIQAKDKLTQQNKHLYTQIEYYRQQFANLIENSNQDNKNEIKKRVKESTNLILKINSLQSENQTLLNDNNRLRNQLDSEKANKTHNKHLNESLEEKFHDIHSKLRLTDKQKEDYRQQMQTKFKEYGRLKEKYEILKKEFKLDCEKYKKEVNELTIELELTKKELHKLKSSSEKEKQILELEINNLQKRESTLKQKLATFELTNKQLFETIKQLKEKNENLEDDLYHAKKIIDKHQENSHQFVNLQKELNEKNVEANTVLKEHRPSYSTNKDKENKATLSESEEITNLHNEIKTLREKITELQKRNLTNYEQIILTLGASEAFKKLLQEKNVTIKKLMREKGEIYAKMATLHQQ